VKPRIPETSDVFFFFFFSLRCVLLRSFCCSFRYVFRARILGRAERCIRQLRLAPRILYLPSLAPEIKISPMENSLSQKKLELEDTKRAGPSPFFHLKGVMKEVEESPVMNELHGRSLRTGSESLRHQLLMVLDTQRETGRVWLIVKIVEVAQTYR
jgi:hypothetical protein